MFNATSVNEAKKSTQLNHYIFVFTVITIIYLPLSFIAVSQSPILTGMCSKDLLNQTDTLYLRAIQLGRPETGSILSVCYDDYPCSNRYVCVFWLFGVVYAATNSSGCGIEGAP